MRRLLSCLLCCTFFVWAWQMPAFSQATPQDRPVGAPQIVTQFKGSTPVGVAVSHTGRIFVTFPRTMDPSPYTVGELKGQTVIPYPSLNDQAKLKATDPNKLVSVQGLTIDAKDRLWLLDSGILGDNPALTGSQKLVVVDLKTNRIVRTIKLPASIAGPNAYLNDIRIALSVGSGGTAFITDSSTKALNAIIVVDLATDNAIRRLEGDPTTKAENNFTAIVEARPILVRKPGQAPSHDKTGVDGLAIGNDENVLYYCPNSSHHLYSVIRTHWPI